MKKVPTYSVSEIRAMMKSMDLDSMKVLIKLIDEEIDLYEGEELEQMTHVALVLFTRSLLLGGLKHLE